MSLDHYDCEYNCGSTLCIAPEYYGTSTSMTKEERKIIKDEAIHDIKEQSYFGKVNNDR